MRSRTLGERLQFGSWESVRSRSICPSQPPSLGGSPFSRLAIFAWAEDSARIRDMGWIAPLPAGASGVGFAAIIASLSRCTIVRAIVAFRSVAKTRMRALTSVRAVI